MHYKATIQASNDEITIASIGSNQEARSINITDTLVKMKEVTLLIAIAILCLFRIHQWETKYQPTKHLNPVSKVLFFLANAPPTLIDKHCMIDL